MFLAGQTSVLRRRWLWCGSGAAAAAAIAAVIFVAGIRARPEPAVHVVYVPIPPAPVQERVTAISPKANVDFVGEFKASPFRGGGFKKGVRPSDLAVK